MKMFFINDQFDLTLHNAIVANKFEIELIAQKDKWKRQNVENKMYWFRYRNQTVTAIATVYADRRESPRFTKVIRYYVRFYRSVIYQNVTENDWSDK